MKKTLLFRLLFIVFVFYTNCLVIAQTTVDAVATTLSADALTEIQEHTDFYRGFHLNLSTLNNLVKTTPGGTQIQLHIGDFQANLFIEPNEIRSENYVEEIEASETKVIHPISACNTYKGYVDGNPDQPLRLYISNDYFSGYIDKDGERYYIRPERMFNETYFSTGKYVIYTPKATPSSPDGEGACPGEFPPLEFLETAIDREGGTLYLEVATDADYDFYHNRFGDDVNSVFAYILGEINELDGPEPQNSSNPIYFQPFNIRFILVYQHVWTVPDNYGSGVNPLNGQEYAKKIWVDFRSWWNANQSCVNRDVAHLFSFKSASPVVGVSQGNATFGYASICGTNDQVQVPTDQTGYQYAYSATLRTAAAVSTGTTAHEIGHNFGAAHNGSGCCIMNSPSCGNTFSTTARGEISKYINSKNKFTGLPNNRCLMDVPVLQWNGTKVVGAGPILQVADPVVCVGEVVTVTFNPAFGVTPSSWSLNSNLQAVSPLSGNSIQIRGAAAGNGLVTVTFNWNCQVLTYTLPLWVGIPTAGLGAYWLDQVNYAPDQWTVSFPPVPFATSYLYQYTIYDEFGHPVGGESGSTTTLLSLLTIFEGDCAQVKVKALNECGTPSTWSTVYLCAPGFIGNSAPNRFAKPQLTEIDQLEVFPNPAIEKVNLFIPGNLQSATLTILDASGKLVLETTDIKDSAISLSTQGWKPGLYLVSLQTTTQLYRTKLLIVSAK